MAGRVRSLQPARQRCKFDRCWLYAGRSSPRALLRDPNSFKSQNASNLNQRGVQRRFAVGVEVETASRLAASSEI
jgi:hypothetical protein